MLKKKTIGHRLKIAFLSISLLVAINGIVGIVMVLLIGHDADVILAQKYPLVRMAYQLETDVASELLALHSVAMQQAGGEEGLEQWHASVAKNFAQLRLLDTNVADLSELENIQTKHRDIERRSVQLVALVKQDQAKTELNDLFEGLDKDLMLITQSIETIVAHAEQDMSSALAAAVAFQKDSIYILISITILAFAAAFWLGKTISGGITHPLNTLVDYSKHVAAGNLKETLSGEDAEDEIGILVRAFGALTDSLRKITEAAESIADGDLTAAIEPRSNEDTLGLALQKMIISLRMQIKEIIEGASVIASSVSELSASSAQLAASAAENASSITETTTTIEEVRQATELTTAKAEQMADEAQRIQETSTRGRMATEETIQGMNKIQTQMDAIVETIIRLSEQSQAIGQIISTVDSLSEQSNVLAVNASIEAAKAGDQGKGFSVVAQEVKSLAEQSKQATKQVRSILNEIQKATSTAVMATELGNKVVEKGTESAKQANRDITALSLSFDQSANAAVQISAGSQQQRIGMDQITAAMESVNEASMQNASSAKQLEGAVYNLKMFGEKLKGIVESYRV
jgi:methyl-accepting chemotaxis protein